MAVTGKFYPFNRYVNDIALMMDDTHKIIPSKFVLLEELKDTSSYAWPDTCVDHINELTISDAESLDDIDYAGIRNNILTFIKNYSKPNIEATSSGGANPNNDLYVGGDINFISHDIYDGMLYSEIYLHVSNEAGLKRYKISVTNQDKHENAVLGPENRPSNAPNNYSFQAVLMFYDIYKSDTEEPFACDIPLGIYILADEDGIASQELTTNDDNLYGNGTSWSTRICSRFVCSASLNGDPKIGTSPSDYATMTRLLSEFGKVIKTMEQNISSREEDMQTIKAYLDDFKHYQTINVPYVLGDWWYVNGRPIKPVDNS